MRNPLRRELTQAWERRELVRLTGCAELADAKDTRLAVLRIPLTMQLRRKRHVPRRDDRPQ